MKFQFAQFVKFVAEVLPDYIQWLRSKVGPRKVILPYATALIADEQGRLLFQRRTDFREAWWGLPGGVLEIGEDFEQCAAREALEETGLRVEPVRLSGVYSSPEYDVRYPNGDEVQQFTVVYECRIMGGDGLPDGVETFEHRFFSAEEFASLPVPRWYADMARHFFERTPKSYHPVAKRSGPDFGKPYFDSPLTFPTTNNFWFDIRQFTGPDRLLAVGASAIIQNTAGQILLTFRREGKWGLPAGLMELNESISGTLVREAKEELNVELAVRELLGVFTGLSFFHTYPDGNQVQIVSTLFRAEITGGELAPDGDETRGFGWFDPANLPQEVLPRHRLLIGHAVINNQGTKS
jgi:ADP-ribose pyrophosphatase YjhB (NUDIX family)